MMVQPISELFCCLAAAGWMQFRKPLPFWLCLPNTLCLVLPVRLGLIQLCRLDVGAVPQQVCADSADPRHVFADVSAFCRVGHGGMVDFVKLQSQACKAGHQSV